MGGRYAKLHPCVGSGHCCKVAPCVASVMLGHNQGGEHADCTMLEYDGERFRCGLVLGRDARITPEEATRSLFVGGGCSSPLFNTGRERALRGLPVMP